MGRVARRAAAGRAPVLLDVTPRQLLRLAGERLPRGYRRRLGRYRYGPGIFKVDWALDGPIPWRAPEAPGPATVHLGGTLEEIAAAERRGVAASIRSGRSCCSCSRACSTRRARPAAGTRRGRTATSRTDRPRDMTDGDRGADRALRARVPRPDRRALGDGHGRHASGTTPTTSAATSTAASRTCASSSPARSPRREPVLDARRRRLHLLVLDAAGRRRARHVRVLGGACGVAGPSGSPLRLTAREVAPMFDMAAHSARPVEPSPPEPRGPRDRRVIPDQPAGAASVLPRADARAPA